MTAISRDTLATRILERAQMEGSTFIAPTTELVAIIEGECGELHDLLLSRPTNPLTVPLAFTIAGGASSYTFTSAFFSMRGLDWQDGSEWRSLRRASFEERNRSYANHGRRGRELRYDLIGPTLFITPPERAPGNYRLWHDPAYVPFATGATTKDFPNGWEEFVIAGGAAKCLAKEESDPSVQLALKERVRQRILIMTTLRDRAAPRRIVDVYARDDDGWEDE